MKKTSITVLSIVFALILFRPSWVDSADYAPGVSFAALLNNVNYQPEKGIFDLGNQMQATFLPEGTKGHVLLKKADGSAMYKFTFVLEAIQTPYTLISFNGIFDVGSGERISGITLKEPGNYTLEFYAEDKLFYKFPFSISKVASADPFAGGDIWLIDGAWNNWGYLFYSGANPEQQLIWKSWLRHNGPGEKDYKIGIQVVRDKDKKLICVSHGDITHSLRATWVRYQFDLAAPEGTMGYGQYFKAKDLLAVDGPYTLTMKRDGQVFGVWKFTVAGGKLVQVGQSDRAKADPISFIEGGRDAFWYKKM